MEDKKIEELKKEYGGEVKKYTRHELERLMALAMTLLKYEKLGLFPVLSIESEEDKFHLFKKEDGNWESYLCKNGVATKRTYNKSPQYYAIVSMLEKIFNISPYESEYADYFYRFCDIDISDKDLELFKKVYVDKKGNSKELYELIELFICLITKYDDAYVCRYYRPLINYDINISRREFTSYTRHELEKLYSLMLTVRKFNDTENMRLFMNADSMVGGYYIIKNPLGCFETFDVDEERGYIIEPRYVFDSCDKACMEIINEFFTKKDKNNEAKEFFCKTYNSDITDEELENFRYFALSGSKNRIFNELNKEETERRNAELRLKAIERGVINEK